MKKAKYAAIFLVPIFVVCVFLAVARAASKKLDVESFSEEVGLSAPLSVVQLSDLHYPKVGVPTDEIVSAVKKISPDCIFLTGDVFDGSAKEEEVLSLERLFLDLLAVAPVFAVNGNHEIGSPHYEKYRALCYRLGVKLLENEAATFSRGADTVFLYGVKDAARPEPAVDNERALKILLAHRPELFPTYVRRGYDYCFCGHAHGGQARIFGVGLYAPDQGFFPLYSSGAYKETESTMFVSRGLGDGKSNFRILNSYHLIHVRFV